MLHDNPHPACFKVEPIYDFSQEDLEEDDVYLLDAFSTLYLWVGGQSRADELAEATKTAEAYINAQGYAEDTPIVNIFAGTKRVGSFPPA